MLETEKVLKETEVARQIVRLEEEIVLKIEHCLVGRKKDLDDSPSRTEDTYDLVASHTQVILSPLL